jgi:NAD(P)-dependent dehydrogenase (short-subunit alcohol dehydrogenase family)
MHKGYFFGKTSLDFDNINFEHNYNALFSYSRSKLYNTLFTRALAEKINTKKGLTASVNPGIVRTKIFYDKLSLIITYIIPAPYSNYLHRLSWPIYWFFTKSP